MRASVFAALVGTVLVSGTAGATDTVEVDYMLNCQGCHLPDGSGFPERNVPSLTNHMGKFLWVDGGRAFLVQVPGAATSDLSNKRLADVLNWMLEKFSADQMPTAFVPYGEDEVAGLRAAPLVNVSDVRTALIEKIEALEQSKDAVP